MHVPMRLMRGKRGPSRRVFLCRWPSIAPSSSLDGRLYGTSEPEHDHKSRWRPFIVTRSTCRRRRSSHFVLFLRSHLLDPSPFVRRTSSITLTQRYRSDIKRSPGSVNFPPFALWFVTPSLSPRSSFGLFSVSPLVNRFLYLNGPHSPGSLWPAPMSSLLRIMSHDPTTILSRASDSREAWTNIFGVLPFLNQWITSSSDDQICESGPIST